MTFEGKTSWSQLPEDSQLPVSLPTQGAPGACGFSDASLELNPGAVEVWGCRGGPDLFLWVLPLLPLLSSVSHRSPLLQQSLLHRTMSMSPHAGQFVSMLS